MTVISTFWWSILVAVLSGTTDHPYICLGALLTAYLCSMSMLGTTLHDMGGCDSDY